MPSLLDSQVVGGLEDEGAGMAPGPAELARRFLHGFDSCHTDMHVRYRAEGFTAQAEAEMYA